MSGFSNVYVGATVNDGTGAPLRNAFQTINQNFANITTNVSVGVTTVANRAGNVTLTVNDIQGAASVGYVNTLLLSNVSINTVNANLAAMVSNIANVASNVTAANAATISANTAMKSYVDAQITTLVTGAPASLNTFSEVAANLASTAGTVATLQYTIADYNANLSAFNATLTANAAVQSANIVALTANAGSQADNITTLLANAAVQSANITTLFSNAATQDSAITSLQSNAATQQGQITTLQANSISLAATIHAANARSDSYTNTAIANLVNSAPATLDTLAEIAANLAAEGGAIASILTAIAETNANVTGANATWTANAAAQADSLLGINVAISSANTIQSNQIAGANVAISALQANIGSYFIWANANVSEVSSRLTSAVNGANVAISVLQANIGGYYIWANANVGGLYNSILGSNAAIVTANTALKSYVDTFNAVQNTWLGNLQANLGKVGNVSVSDQTLSGLNAGNPLVINFTRTVNNHIFHSDGNIVANASTNSTNTNVGAIVVPYGGMGVAGNVYVASAANSRFQVGTGGQLLPNVLAQFTANINSYSQNNMQNLSSGAKASSDYVATADNGNDTSNYLNLGINSSGFNNADYPGHSPIDSYLIANGGNLLLTAETTNKVIKMMVGGHNTANVIGTWAAGGLTVAGNLTVGSSNIIAVINTLTANAGVQADSLLGANAAMVTANTAMKSYVDAVTTNANTITAAYLAAGSDSTISTIQNTLISIQGTLGGNTGAQSLATVSQVTGANVAIVTANTAMKGYVDGRLSTLTNGASVALDTLLEIGSALGNNASFSSVMVTWLGNISANVTTANTAISALQANVGGYYIWANANVAGLSSQLTGANAATMAANTAMKSYVDSVTTAWTANAATQASLISAFTSGQLNLINQVAGANVTIATLQANVGGFYTWANANFGTSTYSNTNVSAYLVANPQAGTYSNSNVALYLTSRNIDIYSNSNVSAYLTGNITAGNVLVTGNIEYIMGNYQNWTSNVTTISSALDQIAQRLKDAGF